MTIAVLFHLNDEPEASAVTGVVGSVTNMLIPAVGDLVRHRSHKGIPFVGRVTSRLYDYEVADGRDVDGSVTVTLSLDRVLVH